MNSPRTRLSESTELAAKFGAFVTCQLFEGQHCSSALVLEGRFFKLQEDLFFCMKLSSRLKLWTWDWKSRKFIPLVFCVSGLVFVDSHRLGLLTKICEWQTSKLGSNLTWSYSSKYWGRKIVKRDKCGWGGVCVGCVCFFAKNDPQRILVTQWKISISGPKTFFFEFWPIIAESD